MGVRAVVLSVIVGVRIVPAAAVFKVRILRLRRRAGAGVPRAAGAAAGRPGAVVVIVRRGVCSQLRGIVIPVRELAARALVYRVALGLRRRRDLRGRESMAVRGLGACLLYTSPSPRD